jgi:hypothetical protein
MQELLMLNDTLMKQSTFSLICHLQKKDSWTPHKAKETVPALGGLFWKFNGEDRMISNGLWPPRSPDLSLCDFHLWGKLKSDVLANNPHDLEAIKQNIREAIYNI